MSASMLLLVEGSRSDVYQLNEAQDIDETGAVKKGKQVQK